MSKDHTEKPKNVDYFQVPRALWRRLRRELPREPERKRAGRKRADNRKVINGIWYVQWTGCQWKAVKKEWFGVCSSTIHKRFQEWRASGVFERLMRVLVKFYDRQRGDCLDVAGYRQQIVSRPAGRRRVGQESGGPQQTRQ